MTTLFLDCETFSECELKTHGTPRYAEHPSTEIMLVQWAIDDGDTVVEDLTESEGHSESLQNWLVHTDCTIVLHNSFFDRTLILYCLGIDLDPERIDDTMVRALAHGMPGGLGVVAQCLGLPDDEAKDKRGKRLIQLFCKPNRGKRATKRTHPAEWAEFVEYSRQDIPAMRNIHKRLPSWNYAPGSAEHRLWCLDQRINDRGFAVDTELAEAALEVARTAQDGMAEEINTLTAGDVPKATQRDLLLKHIVEAHGITMPDMTKDTIRRRLDDPDLPGGVRQLLAIRLEASMTSTGKYAALLKATSADGRLRNTLQFAGAQRTGRWAGRVFQPQNMMRPTMPSADIEAGITLIKARCPEVLFPQVMTLLGNAVRGCIVAPPGRKLVVADLSNIEGRGLAYLASENWKLDAFRAFDAGKGPDLYKLAYARSFGVKADGVTGDQRQIGKVQELGLGYGGGVAAFITFAAVYNMDLDAMADAVWFTASREALDDAHRVWHWAIDANRTLGLSQHVYVACEILKQAWRDAHPKTEALWAQAQAAFADATRNPGATFDAGPLRFRRDGAWLRMRLPSGRYLCYMQPRVDGDGCSYMGVSAYTRQWSRLRTYGGKLIENAVQAWARDVLAHNMQPVEDAGYGIVLSCHDELITETPDDDSFSHNALEKIMATPPIWAPTVPLAAAGFDCFRYRK